MFLVCVEDGLPTKGTHSQLYLKSYTIIPIETVNVLKIIMNVLWGLQVQEPQQEEEGQAQEGTVPGLVQEGSCSGANSLY